MTTYTVLKDSKAWRGKLHQTGPDIGKLILGGSAGWHKIYTDRKVTYTDIDVRTRLKVTDLDYYEFNLPKEAEPYGVLAVRRDDVIVKAEPIFPTDAQLRRASRKIYESSGEGIT